VRARAREGRTGEGVLHALRVRAFPGPRALALPADEGPPKADEYGLVAGRNRSRDTFGRVDPYGFDELSGLASRSVGDGMRVLARLESRNSPKPCCSAAGIAGRRFDRPAESASEFIKNDADLRTGLKLAMRNEPDRKLQRGETGKHLLDARLGLADGLR